MFFLEKIDGFLNSITMYRVILYGLAFLSVVSILFGFFGLLPFSGLQLAESLVTIIVSCYVGNKLFSWVLRVDTNTESWWITGLILFFVLVPIIGHNELIATVLISIIAVASKYFLTFDKKHIFNPAAIACFLAGLFGFGNAVWWVGNVVLLPFVAIVGLLVVRKIRRFQLFFAFVGASILSIGINLPQTLLQVFISWPLIFFGTIMLTEPFTTPPNKRYRMIYGVIVGFLFGSQFSIGPLFPSPEFALIAGNIFSFIVSPKGKLFLKFKEKIQLAPAVYEFIFTPNSKFVYLPGQYMEWTLPHEKSDSRGIRRYFTIASAPEENEIKLGVKIIPDKSSSFKKSLLNLRPGQKLSADQLSGDFVLDPKNQKFVFIAGGIGITPFRSMIKNIIGAKLKKDVVMFYCASDAQEFVYKDIFKKAQDYGVKTIYVLGGKDPAPKNWIGETGYLTKEIIKKFVPDLKERKFYLSGPVTMVNNYKNLLKELGVRNTEIVTDYFPGY
ncbi:oxidoreductase [Candidatus Daviesbacteria bacterium]|nr:oxidoreductase [Candidatus Daviesbacteria bacterium]